MRDTPWPADPRLDPFRNTRWDLRRDGRLVAHLDCRVVPVRKLWARQEQVWYQLTWLDGRREPARLDSGPMWSAVADLERGRFEVMDVAGQVLEANPVEGTS